MVLGSHKVLGGPPGLGIVAVRRSAMDRLLDGAGWSLRADAHDALLKHDYLSGARPTPSGLPPLMTYPIQIVCALRAALRERLAGGLEGGTHAAAAQALRDGLRNIGITPYGAAAVSNAVIRADLPDGVSAEALRAELALRGIFVIGGIGGSGAGSFIRIGTMSSPQLDGANIQRLIEALDDSLTAVGRRAPDRAIPGEERELDTNTMSVRLQSPDLQNPSVMLPRRTGLREVRRST